MAKTYRGLGKPRPIFDQNLTSLAKVLVKTWKALIKSWLRLDNSWKVLNTSLVLVFFGFPTKETAPFTLYAWKVKKKRKNDIISTTRVEVSLISYKDHIWFHTVHTWFLSTILVWNQRNHIWSLHDYQEIIYDPSTNTKNHTLFWKSLNIYVFSFYSVGHHLNGTPAAHCDPPKDPNVQCQLQVGKKIKV